MQVEEVVSSIEARSRKLYTPCGGGRMVWRIWGGGAPLVFIHGGAGSWTHWIRNIPEFEKERMVIAPDLPGLGDSDAPPKPYTPESIAQITADGLLQILPHGETFDLVGFSFGGMISGIMASLCGDRVRTLTLMGPSGLGGTFGNIGVPRKIPMGGTLQQIAEVHRHNLKAIMLHHQESIDELAMYLQSINAPRTRILSPEHALSEKMLNVLPRVSARVASIWGEHDISSPHLEHRRKVISAVHPDAVFHIVPDTGHWVQYEAAAVTNELLRKIIA